MLRACAEASEASSEASRSSGVSGMLRSADSAQHDNSALICKMMVRSMNHARNPKSEIQCKMHKWGVLVYNITQRVITVFVRRRAIAKIDGRQVVCQSKLH